MGVLESFTTGFDSTVTRGSALVDSPNIDYENIVVLAGWLQTAFQVTIYKRQLKMFDLKEPPANLAEHFPKETFDKAQNYGREKLRFTVLKTIVEQFIDWGFIRLHVYSRTWVSTGRFLERFGYPTGGIIHALIWVTAVTVLASVPSLPWDYYSTFVVEAKHGFNKSTKKLWIMDQIKTYTLLAVIGLPFFAGFLKVIEWSGKAFVPYLMLFVLAFQLCMQTIFPIFILPLFNKLEPLSPGDLRDRIEALAGKLHFPLKQLYVMDGSKRSSHSNAFFSGLPWSKQIVLFDTLIEHSSAEEVEAVLGHELGHWKFGHPTKLIGIIQAQLFYTFVLFAIFMHNKAYFAAFGFDPALAKGYGPGTVIVGYYLLQLLVKPLDTVLNFVVNAISRRFEYQADEFSVRLGKKKELADALIKMHVKNLSAPHNDKLYSMYRFSHPTLPERLEAMDIYADSLQKKSQ